MTPLLLGFVAFVVGWILFTGSATALIPLALLIGLRPQTISIGGLFIDGTDFIMAGIVAAFLLRRQVRESIREARYPMLPFWLLIVAWSAAAYLRADINQRYVVTATPFELTYQLYRYAWKDLLFLPIGLIFLREAKGRRLLTASIVAMGVALSVLAIIQGYMGFRSAGTLGGPNALGAALIAPMIVCCTLLVADQWIKRPWVVMLAILVLVRSITFTRSRGAMTGILCGLVVMFGLLFLKEDTRSNVTKWGFIISLGVLAVVLVFPSILERPNIQEALTVFAPSDQHTFNWRTEERWPFFEEKIQNNWWWGVGTDHDSFFGSSGGTPHNGYYSLSLTAGVPYMIAYILCGIFACFQGFRVVLEPGWSERHVYAVAACGMIAGLLVHNIVDRVLLLPITSRLYWFIIAAALAAFVEGRRRAPEIERPVVTEQPPLGLPGGQPALRERRGT